MNRRGIILAGGSGTRLYPLTQVISKQLLPVYDKPMIYYPLSTMMQAGIREILIITTPHEQALFQKLLGDGSQWGIELSYAVQDEPRGLADAFIIGRDFIDGRPSCLILGDNIFHGGGMRELLERANAREHGATVFGRVLSLEEKPARPKSNYAVTGLYFYDERACDFAAELEPSERGELEITDLNRRYLEAGDLTVERMGRGYAWLDTGTHASLQQASSYIETLESRQGLRVACPEEIAFRQGWIGAEQLLALAEPLTKSGYGDYLRMIARTAEPS